jgi:hypothetical protein
MSDSAKVLMWVSFGFEAFLAIPILGGSFVLALYWLPLAVAFILHATTLVFCFQSSRSYYGSVVGLVASLLGWIPILGWMLHVGAAISLLISSLSEQKK